jgi:hypothetical protein
MAILSRLSPFLDTLCAHILSTLHEYEYRDTISKKIEDSEVEIWFQESSRMVMKCLSVSHSLKQSAQNIAMMSEASTFA